MTWRARFSRRRRPARFDDHTWDEIQHRMPIPCVDVVPLRITSSGRREVALIERIHPIGDERVWCQIGGRVEVNETTADALVRHLDETLKGLDTAAARDRLGSDPQPQYVKQWFPSGIHGGPHYGTDPRKHAISQSFLLEVDDDQSIDVVTGGEGLKLRWFPLDDFAGELPLWPGTGHLVRTLVSVRDESDDSSVEFRPTQLALDDPRLAMSYEALSARANTHNALTWQTPGLAIAAQAFLLAIALSPSSTTTSRCFASGLSFVVAVLCLQLFAKHAAMQDRDNTLLEAFEQLHGLPRLHRRPRLVGRLTQYRSRLWWQNGLAGFAVAAAAIFVLALAHPSTF